MELFVFADRYVYPEHVLVVASRAAALGEGGTHLPRHAAAAAMGCRRHDSPSVRRRVKLVLGRSVLEGAGLVQGRRVQAGMAGAAGTVQGQTGA